MAGKIVTREAEMVAGEPIVGVFGMLQFRNRVILMVLPIVLLLAFRVFDYEDFINQLLISALAGLVVSLFMRSRFITITATRALMMESGRVLPVPSRILRNFRPGEVSFLRDGFGESIQIDGKSYNVGKGWSRLRSLMCDEDNADASTTSPDRID